MARHHSEILAEKQPPKQTEPTRLRCWTTSYPLTHLVLSVSQSRCISSEKICAYKIPQHKLNTDVVTRWNSAHDMWQPAVTAALLSHEVRKNEKDISTVSEAKLQKKQSLL